MGRRGSRERGSRRLGRRVEGQAARRKGQGRAACLRTLAHVPPLPPSSHHGSMHAPWEASHAPVAAHTALDARRGARSRFTLCVACGAVVPPNVLFRVCVLRAICV